MTEIATPKPARHFRNVMYGALRGRSTPILEAGGRVCPGASLWSGARAWVEHLRSVGCRPGDRLGLILAPSPGFVMALAAAWWEGLTVVPAAPGTDAESLVAGADVSIIIGDRGGIGITCATEHGLPNGPPAISLGPARFPRTADFCLLSATSGTSGLAKRVPIQWDQLASVVRTHMRPLGWRQGDGRDLPSVSVLPWHHAFGLVVDLLPALLGGAVVHRDPSNGRDPESIAATIEMAGEGVWMSGVPLQFERMAQSGRGLSALTSLRGGVVGGAPAPPGLLDVLRRTRLRTGYGQTECGPGVTLGEPGDWALPGWIGRAVGCETRVGTHGTLEVRGINVSGDRWEPDRGLVHGHRGMWHDTGDRVERVGDGYVFLGRADSVFKLSNGWMVDAPGIEAQIVRTIEGVEEAVVRSRDGVSIEVVLISRPGARSSDAARVRGAVAGTLGALSGRLGVVRVVEAGLVIRTRKGAVDRAKLAAA